MKLFVCVVCGSKEYIETLNFSLKFLRFFSKHPIIIITDKSRNEISIAHDNVIDIKTPIEFDNHQASIYLKTGLYRFVPDINNDTYCYLDSDIVAINSSCNDLFQYKPSPIIFAKDHSCFSEFSPYAMNCNCISIFRNQRISYESRLSSYFMDYIPDNKEILKSREVLNNIFLEQKQHPLKNFAENLKYLLERYVIPKKNIYLSGFRFNKLSRCWFDSSGNMISFDNRYHKPRMWKQLRIRYENENWYDENNNIITPQIPHCNHLKEHILSKFGIDIPASWRHWNGGVFLFNKDSLDFMNYWHKITIEEFEDSLTMTRDQATLAVSTWKFKLQNADTLPLEFNFITEYKNRNICWDCKKGYTTDNFETTITPSMLHIYHNWGDKNWDIWQSVINLGAKLQIIDTD